MHVVPKVTVKSKSCDVMSLRRFHYVRYHVFLVGMDFQINSFTDSIMDKLGHLSNWLQGELTVESGVSLCM